MIFVPFLPRIRFTASKSVMFLVERHGSVQSFGTSVGQIAMIWSRAWIPACAAGVPSIGETTST